MAYVGCMTENDYYKKSIKVEYKNIRNKSPIHWLYHRTHIYKNEYKNFIIKLSWVRLAYYYYLILKGKK